MSRGFQQHTMALTHAAEQGGTSGCVQLQCWALEPRYNSYWVKVNRGTFIHMLCTHAPLTHMLCTHAPLCLPQVAHASTTTLMVYSSPTAQMVHEPRQHAAHQAAPHLQSWVTVPLDCRPSQAFRTIVAMQLRCSTTIVCGVLMSYDYEH